MAAAAPCWQRALDRELIGVVIQSQTAGSTQLLIGILTIIGCIILSISLFDFC